MSQQKPNDMSIQEMVAEYNDLTGKGIKTFRDKPTAIKRLTAARAEAAPKEETEEAPKKKKGKGSGARGRKSYAIGRTIHLLSDGNPHRDGTTNYTKWRVLAKYDGKPAAEYLADPNSEAGYLRYTDNHGWAKVFTK